VENELLHAGNTLEGMHLEDAADNYIYPNEFVNNTVQVSSTNSSDTWHSPVKLAYRYAGRIWVSYLPLGYLHRPGYKRRRDWRYPVDGPSDFYPLIASPDTYELLVEVGSFDTGAPTNPYLSIFGIHNGTITPSSTVIVSRLFTYPCNETGGHTEYAAFYNATGAQLAEADWSGYEGEWHTLSFEPPILLEANQTYRYTIHTSSYPQIHHTGALHTARGWITCSEFVDPNGWGDEVWIPALKLE
jgi:hypothetical protein